MIGAGDEDFYERWAALRAAVATKTSAAAKADIEALLGLARNSRERSLVAPIEIQYGVRNGDQAARDRGLSRLRGCADGELREAIEALPDLTMLGAWADRRSVLERLVLPELDEEDPARSMLEDPGPAAAKTIASGRWSPPPTLTPQLARELRLWVGWAAFEAWLHYRVPFYLDVCRHESVALRPDEPAGWEHAALLALCELSVADVDRAVAKMAALWTRLGRERTPRWVERALVRISWTYAPLAGQRSQEWLGALPTPDPAPTAGSDLEAASFEFVRMGTGAVKPRPARLEAIGDTLRDHPWLAFCWFIAGHSAEVSRRAAEHLLGSVRRPEDARTWPWPGRSVGFADACCELADRRLALELLVTAMGAERSEPIRRACAHVLNSASVDDLVAIRGSDTARALGDALELVDGPRREMLRRGGTYRAVVDGSNVMWAGKSRRAGAKPSLDTVKKAISALEGAGFLDLVIYFDRSTRHDATPSDWEQVERWQADKRATITVGSADEHIIEAFLRAPEETVIVTLDEFRNELAARGDVRPLVRSAIRRFFVEGDELVWVPPLDARSEDGR